MSDNCPHCGLQLPVVRDAFCPECREPLDEAPADRWSIQAGGNQPSLDEAPAHRWSIQAGGSQPSFTPPDIVGAQGLTWDEIASEVRRGGRLVVFQYCISVGVLTFIRPSKVHLVRSGDSAVAKGWTYTLLSMVAGWWGFPWGFIYTPLAVASNLGGGTNVTASLVGHLLQGPLAEPGIADVTVKAKANENESRPTDFA
jgi:hypothetical protein